jgi:Putative prokaryotic signal transducing protein
MSDEWHRVFVANGEVHAQQICAFLETSGIPATIQGESLRHTHGLTVDGLGTVSVLVEESDAERARALLRSAEAGRFWLSDDPEDDEDDEPPKPERSR